MLNQSQLSGMLGNLSQIKQMANQVRSISNPQAMISQMAQNDPTLKQAMDGANGDYEQVFKAYARANGVDPDQVISTIRGMF